MIFWDPAEQAILGGYRFIFGDEVHIDPTTGKPRLATADMFDFSPQFLSDYLPYTIELGRSFVSLPYQSTRMGAKSLRQPLGWTWCAHGDLPEDEVFLWEGHHVQGLRSSCSQSNITLP